MFHTDDEFLRAIEQQPTERTARLVYADWLDERDDPRGALIRIEEEMRQVPVFADRFWELKPRRNELRAVAGAEWCGRMRHGTECEPVFRHGIPDGWRERWRLIREFTERWHRIPLGDVGGRQQEIAEAEARLGRTLPPSVREWVAFAYDVRRDSRYHDVLRDVYDMGVISGQPAVSLLAQAEGDFYWGIRFTDFTLPDPPVLDYCPDSENGRYEVCVPVPNLQPCPSLTSFVLAYAMGYAYGEGGGFHADVPESAQLLRDLAQTFLRPTRFDIGDIYEIDNLMVTVTPSNRSAGVWLGVRAFKAAPEQVPAFIWNYTRFGVSFRDRMFLPEELRRES
jgi:uncharacterized protein (TIGR02996 family)